MHLKLLTFGRISGYMAERLPSGGRVGRKETAMSEPTYHRAIESRNLAGIMPIHCGLFLPNFMTKFGLEDLQSQGRVRPPPSETAFSR